LLHARPCGHHRRAGRGTSEALAAIIETGSAPGAPSTRFPRLATVLLIAYLRHGLLSHRPVVA
jgi:hypothetical protein